MPLSLLSSDAGSNSESMAIYSKNLKDVAHEVTIDNNKLVISVIFVEASGSRLTGFKVTNIHEVAF